MSKTDAGECQGRADSSSRAEAEVLRPGIQSFGGLDHQWTDGRWLHLH